MKGTMHYQVVLIPEQITCSSCGKEHDLDYPKCPYCGFRKE